MHIRRFQNTDPPKIVALWRNQPIQRGLAQHVDVTTLEALVFAKPYFDPAGFLIAEENGQLLGFAHAGFGPNEQHTQVSTEMGVICLVMVDPQCDYASVARPLLEAAEDYLVQRGARVIYGGPVRPLNPFYIGLYGGSELPGILKSHSKLFQLFESAGYQPIEEIAVLQCDLGRFRPPVDRQQLLIKRNYRVTPINGPPGKDWWDACTAPFQDPIEFGLFTSHSQGDYELLGHATYWLMDPLSRGWGAVAVGLSRVDIHPPLRGQGLGTFLVADSLRQLRHSGANLVEAQTMSQNTPAIRLYHKLGFQQVDQGIVFRRPARPGTVPAGSA